MKIIKVELKDIYGLNIILINKFVVKNSYTNVHSEQYFKFLFVTLIF